MAGSKVTVVITQVEKQRLGYTAISLSNFGADTECKIQAGSKVEIGGTLFTFDAEEALTGWTGIGNDNDVYMKLVVSGDTVTAVFTETVPTWSTSKQGWYDSLDRYIGGLYKDGSGNYSYKWMYKFIPAREGGSIHEVGKVISNIVKKKFGYIWCDGSTVSHTANSEYTRLVYLLKKEAGVDTGHPYYHADSDKAVLPDMRGAVVRGIDVAANRDKDGVRKSGNYQADKVLNHKHDLVVGDHYHLLVAETSTSTELTASNHLSEQGNQVNYEYVLKATPSVAPTVGKSGAMIGGTGETGNPKTGGAIENIMKNISLYYLIKY